MVFKVALVTVSKTDAQKVTGSLCSPFSGGFLDDCSVDAFSLHSVTDPQGICLASGGYGTFCSIKSGFSPSRTTPKTVE